MITIPCTYRCDGNGCESNSAGVLEPFFQTTNGQPAGLQLNPRMPAGWSARPVELSPILTARSPSNYGMVAFHCAKCTKAIAGESEEKP